MNEEQLRSRIEEIARAARLEAVAVAVHDYQTGAGFELNADRWFHAASVIKVAVLLAVFKAVEEGPLRLDDPLHVRNRFRSAADGSIYRIDPDRDGDAACHRRTGRTMRIDELARAMIVRSSNLATNLLLDLVGLEYIQRVLSDARIEGVRVVRGVEDQVAHERGLNNEMTAAGARRLFRAIKEEGGWSADSRERMRDILLAQEFNAMIPARLPSGVKVAHKTGEISTHSHDAGIVHPLGRQPYVVAIFTQSAPDVDRTRAVAEISGAIFSELTR
jgi:beta-lactamase class A